MLKVAIAGCGLISIKKHIPAFIRLGKKVKIIAVCDLNEQAAKYAAHKFNIEKTYRNFSDMLLKETPDIVDICTPPQTHAGLAIQAIRNGAHVFLEKPMALKASDCDAMIEAASKYKRKICVMHNQIFNPVFIRARERLLLGEIGDFLGINIFISTPTDYMTSKKEHWAHQLPGGVLGETGPHGVYLAKAFLKDIYDIGVCARKVLLQYPWSNFEDYRINLFAKNGIGSITLNYASNQWAADIVIMGTKGLLKIDLETQMINKYNRTNLGAVNLGLTAAKTSIDELNTTAANGLKVISGRMHPAHFIGIRNFIESILEDKDPGVRPQEAREVARIMEQIVERLRCAE